MPVDHTSAANPIDHLAASLAAPERDRAQRNPDMPVPSLPERSLSVPRAVQQPIIDNADFKGLLLLVAFLKQPLGFHASGRLGRIRGTETCRERLVCFPFFLSGRQRIELEHA